MPWIGFDLDLEEQEDGDEDTEDPEEEDGWLLRGFTVASHCVASAWERALNSIRSSVRRHANHAASIPVTPALCSSPDPEANSRFPRQPNRIDSPPSLADCLRAKQKILGSQDDSDYHGRCNTAGRARHRRRILHLQGALFRTSIHPPMPVENPQAQPPILKATLDPKELHILQNPKPKNPKTRAARASSRSFSSRGPSSSSPASSCTLRRCFLCIRWGARSDRRPTIP
jgi:hypothetical protein